MPNIQKVDPNHIHVYERRRTNKEFYRCVHPACTHYSHRDLLENKTALCGICLSPFQLSWEQLRNKIPRCENCSKAQKIKSHAVPNKSIMEPINEILQELGSVETSEKLEEAFLDIMESVKESELE